MNKIIKYWTDKIKEYLGIDFNKVLSDEINFLIEYKRDREYNLLKLKARKSLYEEIIKKLPDSEKEVFLEDLEMFDVAIDTIEIELDKLEKKINLMRSL